MFNYQQTDLNSLAVWDRREDKVFENSLVEIPDSVENRWQIIANRIPGKSPEDVMHHYEALLHDVGQIDAGLVEPPSYPDGTAPLGSDDRPRAREAGQISFGSGSTRSRHCDVERKKGTPWTEEEHRLFLEGLDRFGKGDWRSISRNVVITRTPTQVASHAQKYYIRQSAAKKERKRSSIHDITTSVDSLTVPAQPSLPAPNQRSFQTFQFQDAAR
ncbi:transcription factor DIVARICATA-like [Primulina eburnea]|uniref:transcription factor DIVARICATA-like n=1 Tax=Primulina eburnea TaxID=1245227 RepID=UPI003C6BE78E